MPKTGSLGIVLTAEKELVVYDRTSGNAPGSALFVNFADDRADIRRVEAREVISRISSIPTVPLLTLPHEAALGLTTP